LIALVAIAPGRCGANVIITGKFVWRSVVAPAASRGLSDALRRVLVESQFLRHFGCKVLFKVFKTYSKGLFRMVFFHAFFFAIS